VDAFVEATEGIRHGLTAPVKAITVDLADNPAQLSAQLGAKEIAVIVTVGNNAYEAAARFGTAPVIATMILRADLSAGSYRAPASAVVLDMPLTDILAALARVFPGKTRVGMIRNPGPTDVPVALLLAQAKAAGVTLRVLDCPKPEGLLQSFLSLKALVDFVWCPPDGTLYNATTVRPLILASLEKQLPVVGFSASFVRAGAAAGVYPDYLEAGVQAGELAQKYLAGPIAGVIEGPRKIRLAVNPRVARLLGLRLAPNAGSDSGIVVIE
jgi:putative ABC transport system substrate-binding protein